MLSRIVLVFAWIVPFSTAQPSASVRPSEGLAKQIQEILWVAGSQLNASVFVYEADENVYEPSDVYTLPDFSKGLQSMYEEGVDGKYFYIGDESTNGYKYGVVNIAAFLAQVMKESLNSNSCDENNWQAVNGFYPISNSCGQLGQNYQDYTCPAGQESMACPVDTSMIIVASTNPGWYGAPPPLRCGPTFFFPTTGYWDYTYVCNQPNATPPESCTAYEGHRAGKEYRDTAFANQYGRTDIEGCCWWGRGAIQTTGPCNMGRLNYYIGKGGADNGMTTAYPSVDICSDPGQICSSVEFPELKWVAGLFYWIDQLQAYNSGWDYLTALHDFVDGGMVDPSFIESVSGIVNRGCHNPPCQGSEVDGAEDRATNFNTVLTLLMDIEPTSRPPVAPIPTAEPASEPTSETRPPAEITVQTGTPSFAPTGETDAPTEMVEMCCSPSENSTKPVMGCKGYYFCFNGTLLNEKPDKCRGDLLWNYAIQECDDPDNFECIDSLCENGVVVDVGLPEIKISAATTTTTTRQFWTTGSLTSILLLCGTAVIMMMMM